MRCHRKLLPFIPAAAFVFHPGMPEVVQGRALGETAILAAAADTFPDERAVLIEPFAGGIHAALLAAPVVAGRTDPVVAVLGAGTMGLAAYN